MIYTEPLPYLTVMTPQTTTVPADTYSEYIATYTTTETGSTNFFAFQGLEGIAADTAAVNSPAAAVTTAPVTDTAITLPEMDTVFTSVSETSSEAAETTVPAESEASGISGTSAPESPETSVSTSPVISAFTNHSIELPPPDTASPHEIQADTAPTRYSGTSGDSGTDTNTSNGGTE